MQYGKNVMMTDQSRFLICLSINTMYTSDIPSPTSLMSTASAVDLPPVTTEKYHHVCLVLCVLSLCDMCFVAILYFTSIFNLNGHRGIFDTEKNSKSENTITDNGNKLF